MILQVPGPELTVPTPIPFQNVRLVAPTRSITLPDDATEAALESELRRVEEWQMAWLNRRETEILADYGRPPRVLIIDMAAQPKPMNASAEPSVAPPRADKRVELRRLALKLQELTGEPVLTPPPKTAAEQDALIVTLTKSIKDLEPTRGVIQSWDDVPARAADRRCSNVSQHRKEPRLISSAEWEYSVESHGQPLCKPCQTLIPRLEKP